MPLRVVPIVLTLFFAIASAAQKQANVWYFGDHAGLDFNGSEPQALLDGQTYMPLPNLWNEGTATICDSSGALLFYSNGAKIWNHAQQVMLNGDSLVGHPSSTQAALILARPGSERNFFVFTTPALEGGFSGRLRYSVVDMCLDNGMGGVVLDQKNVELAAGAFCEKIAAVRHENGMDYWILTHGYETNTFMAFLLTGAGITDTVTTSLGPTDVLGWGGQMAFSPNGDLLAYAYPSTWGSLSLFDFDRSSGQLSNPRTHQNAIDDQAYGVAFSPDNTKLYVTSLNAGKIFQYDLNLSSWAQTVANRTLLAAENPSRWLSMALGPDGMVYIANNGRQYLARIGDPNAAGTACQYLDEAVYLGGATSSFGLPTLVTAYHYDNQAIQCGSPVSGINEHQIDVLVVQDQSGVVQISGAPMFQQASLEIFDPSGRMWGAWVLPNSSKSEIHVGSCTPGLYFYRLRAEGSLATGRLIIERH